MHLGYICGVGDGFRRVRDGCFCGVFWRLNSISGCGYEVFVSRVNVEESL